MVSSEHLLVNFLLAGISLLKKTFARSNLAYSSKTELGNMLKDLIPVQPIPSIPSSFQPIMALFYLRLCLH